jgi:hypothetical protein
MERVFAWYYLIIRSVYVTDVIELTFIHPTPFPVSHCISAGLKELVLVAGPPITVSLNVSAPIVMFSDIQAVMFRGYRSKGGDKVLEVNICSPVKFVRAETTSAGTRLL